MFVDYLQKNAMKNDRGRRRLIFVIPVLLSDLYHSDALNFLFQSDAVVS